MSRNVPLIILDPLYSTHDQDENDTAPWPLWLGNVRRARQSSALVILACHGVGFAERAATTTIHDTTDHIELTPSERLSLGNLNLELGTVTEQVLVSSAATPVQTASAERSTSLTANQVTNLTMYGRTVTSLVALSPGVVDTIGANNRALGGGGGNGINFNIAGSRSTNNGFTIDGITLNAVGGAPNASYGISMGNNILARHLCARLKKAKGRPESRPDQVLCCSPREVVAGVISAGDQTRP